MNATARYFAATDRLDDARLRGSQHRINCLQAMVDQLVIEAREALAQEEQARKKVVDDMLATFTSIFKNFNLPKP